MNPSSGNPHPTKGHAVLFALNPDAFLGFKIFPAPIKRARNLGRTLSNAPNGFFAWPSNDP